MVDQPVGTGFSVGNDIANDNAEVTADFVAYLGAFYEQFPGLKDKKTYLMSESWGGIYVPYMADAILNSNRLSINLKGIAIGNAFFSNPSGMNDVVYTSYLRDHARTLQIPSDYLDEFKAADKQCGFDKVLHQLTYPPTGKISIPGNPEQGNIKRKRDNTTDSPNGPDEPDCIRNPRSPADVYKAIFQPCHGGCATYSIGLDYLYVKFPCFNAYNIDYTCDDGLDESSFLKYLNRPEVKTAIHVTNKPFATCNYTVLQQLIDPYPPPPAYEIIPRILTKIPVHLYSGERDALLVTLGTELAIQNMTWNGRQGFSARATKNFMYNEYTAGTWTREVIFPRSMVKIT
ncbi:MAG: hypothetical protein M1814_000471 [Vezdaea aestivalis]|nr:MAG: hypothetical protein M1814_000471 [Vezdaea aestivalis]